MLGQPVEVVLLPAGREDGGVSGSYLPAALALEGLTDCRCTGRGPAVGHELVDEADQLIGEPDGDSCGHHSMVPPRDLCRYGLPPPSLRLADRVPGAQGADVLDGTQGARRASAVGAAQRLGQRDVGGVMAR